MGANFVYEMLSLLVYLLSLRSGIPLLGAKPAALSWCVLSCLWAQWGLFGGSIYLSLRNIKHLCNQKSDHIDNRFWLKSEEANTTCIAQSVRMCYNLKLTCVNLELKKIEGTPDHTRRGASLCGEGKSRRVGLGKDENIQIEG